MPAACYPAPPNAAQSRRTTKLGGPGRGYMQMKALPLSQSILATSPIGPTTVTGFESLTSRWKLKANSPDSPRHWRKVLQHIPLFLVRRREPAYFNSSSEPVCRKWIGAAIKDRAGTAY